MINNKIATIIVASGIGNRFSIVKKDNNPKQYIELNSEDTVISMTIKKFLKNPRIYKVLVVINEKHINLFNESLKKITEYNEKLLPFVIGGETRKDSVYNALKKLRNAYKQNVSSNGGNGSNKDNKGLKIVFVSILSLAFVGLGIYAYFKLIKGK